MDKPMKIAVLKKRTEEYFETFKIKPQEITLAGFTRHLDFNEGDLETFMMEPLGRKAILNSYLQLAEILEQLASDGSNSAARRDVLKAVDKFIGGLYSFDNSSKAQFIEAKTAFYEIGEETQKKLMQSIANRR